MGTTQACLILYLIGKGFDVNSELFDGDGELGKDIFYFYLSCYYENVDELVEGFFAFSQETYSGKQHKRR